MSQGCDENSHESSPRNNQTKNAATTLSVVSNQGPLAMTSTSLLASQRNSIDESTISSTKANYSSSPVSAAGDSTTKSRQGSISPTSRRKRQEEQQEQQQQLDFIGSSPAVKSLFSIPISEQPVCVAVHNVDGTLLIDEVVVTDDQPSGNPQGEASTSSTFEAIHLPQTTATHVLPQSSPSLALALGPAPGGDLSLSTSNISSSETETLSVLSKLIQPTTIGPVTEHAPSSSTESDRNAGLPTMALTVPASLPTPVQEYVEWKLQDMNLLVGSDAVVVRPDPKSGVLVRVEDVQKMQQLADIHQLQARPTKASIPPTTQSYAQALRQSQPKVQTKQAEQGNIEYDPLNLDRVHLQTCIVPSSGPMNGWMSAPHLPSTSMDTQTTAQSMSPKCFVLDAYLDNLMTNVPQLALCLREKGLIQSVKLMDRDQIPAMMMHPNTLDTSKPVDIFSGNSTTDMPDLFSPEIMEMNASTLLRFLKANCTQNNTTYLLRSDGGDFGNHNNIQLFDISSISQQRQKKWIWWLATMSYRFALRLRQLEAHDALPMRQRAFRDRQRSLLQTTLDLLQDLHDMDGKAHESMVASVREHLADTFLGEFSGTEVGGTDNTTSSEKNSASPSPVLSSSPPTVRSLSPPKAAADNSMTSAGRRPPNLVSQSSNLPGQSTSSESIPPNSNNESQPYPNISTDALNKAHDHLVMAIKALWPSLPHVRPSSPTSNDIPSPPSSTRRRKRRQAGLPSEVTANGSPTKGAATPSPAIVSRLFGLNYKLVNVSLRLAEHYLRQYSSSSAMQALRNSARRMADSISLLEYIPKNSSSSPQGAKYNQSDMISRLYLQSAWLWEHGGHFARSFASDGLWRDRGHASGDDIVSVLQDIEAAFSDVDLPFKFSDRRHPLEVKTKGQVSLQSLSGLCDMKNINMESKVDYINYVGGAGKTSTIIGRATELLEKQGLLKRDKRKVLVASCLSYGTAIAFFQELTESSATYETDKNSVLSLLYQRKGDACNETGKALLASLRSLLTEGVIQDSLVADLLLDSAQFWFQEGLEAFGASQDFRNISLLRCNLCQCFKLRANAIFSSRASSEASHAEVCLEDAASQLQAAHETLGQRDVDPRTWDMVSEELAATFLVLAVRRRQSLLGGGNVPVFLESLRLTPGKERSITEPMEKALTIYEQSRNLHQAAAVHYQLALTYSKIWTCQRDEAKTREKLSAAFHHYNQAFGYFSSNLRGKEPTFVLLCLDIASLYTAVSGEECLIKALTRCLDTFDAFSSSALDYARKNIPSHAAHREWMSKLETLAISVDERIFKLMRSLVKLDGKRWKDLYREGLSAKMVQNVDPKQDEAADSEETRISALYKMLTVLRMKFEEILKTDNKAS